MQEYKDGFTPDEGDSKPLGVLAGRMVFINEALDRSPLSDDERNVLIREQHWIYALAEDSDLEDLARVQQQSSRFPMALNDALRIVKQIRETCRKQFESEKETPANVSALPNNYEDQTSESLAEDLLKVAAGSPEETARLYARFNRLLAEIESPQGRQFVENFLATLRKVAESHEAKE